MNQELYIDDDLLVKYLLGEALQAEAFAVEAWLQASDENMGYYNQLKKVWEQSLELAPQIQIDENQAWQRFQQRLAAKPVDEKSIVVNLAARIRKHWMAAAAVFILLTTGIVLLLNPGETTVTATIEKTTGSETAIDTLQDGSIITLNKNSALSYPQKFKGPNRTVSLKGEAFFEVKPDKTKPFIIHANDVMITVVGTSFNVKNYDSSTEVIVETGIVRVSYLQQSVELTKGEKVIIESTQSTLERKPVSNSLYNYYRTGSINCDATPLGELVSTLNHAYDVSIILAKPSLENLQITAVFEKESIDNILEIVAATLDLSVSKQGSNYIIDSK